MLRRKSIQQQLKELELLFGKDFQVLLSVNKKKGQRIRRIIL